MFGPLRRWSLSLSNRFFRWLYRTTYFDLVARAPHLLGWMYDRLDRPAQVGESRARTLFEKLNLRRFVNLVRHGGFDLALSTHFLSAGLIAHLRKAGKLDLRQMTITTDFDPHRLWVNEPCERYFVATPEARAGLAAVGVAESDILLTGIPVHPVFAVNRSKAEYRAGQGIANDRPVVLLLAGGLTPAAARRILEGCYRIERPLSIVAVTGRSPQLRSHLEGVECPRQHHCQILGFTDKIDQIMGAADVVITKPGGLTSAESLARGLPMVIVDPIPGQETRNADYLLENGAAVKVNNLAALSVKLGELLGDGRRLEEMRERARRIARPGAAYEVAEVALSFIR